MVFPMKVRDVNWNNEGSKAWQFFCPACNSHHAPIEGRWDFNGDYEKPTFYPSILVRSGHYYKDDGGDCWCTYNAKHPNNPSSFECFLCHSFVTDGKIQYLSDCSHKLAGKTVELPDIDL